MLDPSLQADFKLLLSFKGADADLSVEARSLDGSVWLVAYSRDDAATEYCVYDRWALRLHMSHLHCFNAFFQQLQPNVAELQALHDSLPLHYLFSRTLMPLFTQHLSLLAPKGQKVPA